ncbi:alpha/beta fold hydrolase [Hymenobacter cellulosilyticus]|uniref:Alpha/beta fold hydrolase n=1 Tax=Hymenobacter cellulosilyticus TaxID=2932248 RepID=A0A8T9Q0I7_9BACT|nr:alpha/beta fold hydrolase [Hymenobacter cellulosilyticus]UOQ70382.1 alpha/beta fold hydrolase [Hymenobacter cellulosilyticus]
MRKLIVALLALVDTTTLACQKADPEPAKKKATMVLVHGAWQGAYTWAPVVSKLEQQGYTVVNVELLAHGKDQTAAAGLTMNRYRDQVLAAINAQPAAQVVLVGHSLGEPSFRRWPKLPQPRLPSWST